MSAMVETLDAQMTDYNTSDDVFMQTHSDPWIPEDGTMDDDSFHSFSQTDVSKLPSMDSMVPIEASMSLPFSAISASNSLLPMGEDHAVEVEMEEYIEEPEYDMLDDEHVEEIHDVEVHDLQAAAAQRAPQITFSFSNKTTTSIAEITSLVTPVSSTSRQSPALTQESSADQPAHPQDNVETSFERTESSHAAPTEPTPDVPAEVSASAVGRVSETVELERRDPDATHPVEEAPEDDIRALPDAEPSEQEVLAPLLEEPQTPLPTSVEELQETVVVAEHVDEVSSEVPLSEPHEDHEDAAVEGSNPHEILAGVYIEPPPGVLLEVPSGHPSYSLFNLPSYSGHTTPSDEEANAVDDAIVLLHDRPTLFYEPIFSVFEALREEEPFSSSPDLRELELMFSFPSLNLVISEDNVYARQTSLHEVIMLHETFGGSGPLRAQLQLQSRFIIRFSELQAAMEQSAIGQNEEEVDIEVHADDQIPEIVEDATPEHAEAQHNEHSEREALPPSSHDGAPADVEGEAPSDVADLPDPNAVEPTNHAQEAQERAHAAAHSLPEPQSAASDETVAGEPAEVHEDMQNPPLERNDGGEEQDGESQNGIGDNIEEAADLVDYEEEFEGEEGEYYDEEHDESDATETPGDEYEHAEPTGAHETDAVHETNLDEAALVVERADSTFGDESNGTDDDGLHDVDQGLNEEQDRTIVEHAHVQEGDGHVAERERPGLNLNEHRHEGSTEESHHVEPFDEFPDFSELPELPEEEDELWDDEQDGEGELDLSEEHEYEPVEDNEESASNGTSVTLSSKGSKRAFSEVDDEYEEEDNGAHPPVHTPEKRTRLQ